VHRAAAQIDMPGHVIGDIGRIGHDGRGTVHLLLDVGELAVDLVGAGVGG
jgi:hypothetical protein